jgi:alpha-tubulin suppressor-like RCC1 family protein
MLITSSCLPKSDIQISIQKATDSTPPVALLSGVETFYNGSESLNISVSSTNPSNISSYRYKIGGASIDCIDPTGYSAEIPTSFPIIDNISSFTSNTTSNNTKLCVVLIDSSGNQQSYSQATTASWVTDIVGTVATLTGLPESSDNALNVTVGAETSSELVSYKYKIGPQSTTDCSSSTGYSSALAKALDIENDLTSFDDVPMRLCVVSIDTAGNEQALGSATSRDWLLTRTKISTGLYGTCMIDRLGDLRCWGDNALKPIGTGASGKMLPTIVNPGVKYKEITSGYSHTCGITTTGTLKCWGHNTNYQLGDGTLTQRSTPVVIDSGVSYKEIATHYHMTCGITVSGELKCWGTSNSGIGDGFNSRSIPSLIDSGTTYQKVSVNSSNVCAITSTNSLKCWGNNSWGQVGDLTTTNRLTPILIHSGTLYKDISVGAFTTCALKVDGVVKCWGQNTFGGLGNGTTINSQSAVIADSGVSYNSLTKVGNTYSTFCGITTNGSLKCWGPNGYGQLGDTTYITKTSPTLIDGSEKYSYVSSGALSSCGVKTNGEIKCWGGAVYAPLGNDYDGNISTPNLVTSPITFSNLPTGNSSIVSLDIALSSPGVSPGFTTTAYKYKIGASSSLNCSSATGYSSARPLTDHIVEDISALPDGMIGLCVQKINEFGNSESLAVIIQKTWRKMTVATLSISGEFGSYGYNFGIVDSGFSASATLTLINLGPLSAENISFGVPSNTGIFDYTGGVFPGTGGDCINTITPGSGCTIQITYSPSNPYDTDSIVINYDSGGASNSFTINLTGQLRVYGCTNTSYPNYNPSANTDNGSCSFEMPGCTDSTANNYNSSATYDNGSCTYTIMGCMDSNANNYNPSANIDNGSCTYTILGCTNSSYPNYNPSANTDDGSCSYTILGCTDPSYSNYNSSANTDDGSCSN